MVLLCKTIADYSSSNGALPFFLSIRDCVPFAFEGALFAIFIVLFAGNYFLIKERTGRPKILVSLLASSFVLIILSLMLAFATIISFNTVLIYAFLTIISFILLLVSDSN